MEQQIHLGTNMTTFYTPNISKIVFSNYNDLQHSISTNNIWQFITLYNLFGGKIYNLQKINPLRPALTV